MEHLRIDESPEAQLYWKVVRDCACDRANATLVEVILIDALEVSLWISQTELGDDVGYVVKFKHHGVFAKYGESLRNADMGTMQRGFTWAMSRIRERSVRTVWPMPESD